MLLLVIVFYHSIKSPETVLDLLSFLGCLFSLTSEKPDGTLNSVTRLRLWCVFLLGAQ